VPLIVCSADNDRYTLRRDGALQDIAPTMLGILGIQQPKEMTGHDLRQELR
jgi:2,3-bisphosphoglycerate-independent phosphoglycerate mutase